MTSNQKRYPPAGKRHTVSIKNKVIVIVAVFLMICVVVLAFGYFQSFLLNSVRAYVRGEGLYAKAQKEAAFQLQGYAYTGDPEKFMSFQSALMVPRGDRAAREAMQLPEPDLDQAFEGLLAGQNHPEDIPGVIWLFLHFQDFPYMTMAISIWEEGDQLIEKLARTGDRLRDARERDDLAEVHRQVEALDAINLQLAELENEFSRILSEGSRWVKNTLIYVSVSLIALLFFLMLPVIRYTIRVIDRAEKDLVVSENRFRSLYESNILGIFDWHDDGRVADANDSFLRMLGYSREDLEEGRLNWRQLTPEEESPKDDDALEEVRLFGYCEPYEKNFQHREGRRIPVLVGAARLGGKLDKGICFNIDQSQRKIAEQALLEKRKAEAANEAKSRFLANMSHEIRTPLSGVLGLAQLGERQTSLRKAHEMFRRIDQSGKHLLHVVNDILDFSRMEADKLRVENRPFSIVDVLDQVVSLIKEQARTRKLTFDVRTVEHLHPWMLGDPQRLEQILLNLLSNALKFTEQGGVVLDVSTDSGELVIRIRDTGIGMTAEQLSHVYTPFEQADDSTTRRYGGTGLGLAISRNLTTRMGGTIVATSAPDQGSEFTLRLPYIAAAPPPGTGEPKGLAPRDSTLAGLNLLAVEDLEINRVILEDILLRHGALVTLAEDGLQAEELVRNRPPDTYDLVLMDIQMPGMDGCETTRRIHRITPAVPVIGLTAHALEDDRSRCFAAGMVDHISKPIDARMLVDTVLRHARQARQDEVTSDPI